MYSFILFNSYIQFYCNRKNCSKSENNLCKVKIVFIGPEFLDEYFRTKLFKFCLKYKIKRD